MLGMSCVLQQLESRSSRSIGYDGTLPLQINAVGLTHHCVGIGAGQYILLGGLVPETRGQDPRKSR
ncbi:hypothetical protein AN958_00448 [Leucoagaricus sp. SymC.cos]|nr:hypothetical protein AN958_00448 [Leucoagaricus sp. SymC.cos]